jgi:ABC-2 type transport system ATP-binding protein
MELSCCGCLSARNSNVAIFKFDDSCRTTSAPQRRIVNIFMTVTISPINPGQPMISAENLTYDYPGLRALHEVSFRVARGSITALVGPNGAGKTTLLRCLAALDSPLEGQIYIDGLNVQEEPRECHRKVGFLPDAFGLYRNLTVRQCLTHVALAQRLPPAQVPQAVETTAAQVGLAEKLEARAGELSRGQRQRVAIGQAIIHRPPVILLDEPASGLDPEARHALSALFLSLRDAGMTLLVSSHILAELEEYSTDMLVLRGGRLVDHAPIRPVQQRTRLCLTFAEPVVLDPAILTGLEPVSIEATRMICLFDGDARARHELIRRLIEAGLPLCGCEEEKRNLQEAYLATVRGDTHAHH